MKNLSLTDNPFLEDLYPSPKPKKGFYYKNNEPVVSTAAFRFSPLTAKNKAIGVVEKRPEVVVRIGKPNLKTYTHLVKATDYIARNGKLEIEDQDGNIFFTKNEYRQKLIEWKLLSNISEEEAKLGHARRFILSMPSGTDEQKFQAACKMWAKDMFDGFDYLMAFHFQDNDKKTKQPHCHILLRTISRENKRFHLNNQETAALREHFASCLIKCGIEANATKRWSRGRDLRSQSQAELHVQRNRSMTNEERARVYAMSKKRKLLRNQQKRFEKITTAFKNNEKIKDCEAITKAKKNRNRVKTLATAAATQLLSSADEEDRKLGKSIKMYYDSLAPVESLEQRILRGLNEEKAIHIRRMKAMKKRK